MPNVNEVDAAFVIDVTASMGTFIRDAQRLLVKLLKEMSGAADIDLCVGIIEYRDHPPEDRSFVTRSFALTGDLQKVNNKINRLSVDGGGDGPEAVWDGLIAASKLKWRKHAVRMVILVGDAPPHGYLKGHDAFPDGCPCGETAESCAAAIEGVNASLHTLGLNQDASITKSFTEVASLAGGQFFRAYDNKAINSVTEVLKTKFADVDLDRNVYDAVQSDMFDVVELAETLKVSEHKIHASHARLFSRELIEVS